ncbi:MAG TPA: AAA family ATPase [Streptosporangiaceae bacterium]|nr:AAA family ATPase [Streptosporangiaceae bacterium]
MSGVPGAGKSTLAGPLAAGLGFALLGKDRIKETLHEALGAPPAGQLRLGRPWTKWLGGAAMELLWALAADAPDVVLEANFRPHSEYERGRITALTALGGQIVEVYCDCPVDLATARYNGRAATRHPVHVVDTLTAELAAEFGQPIGLGELVTVDTSVPADVAWVVDEVLARFERLGQSGLRRSGLGRSALAAVRPDADLADLGESSP